MRLIRVVLALAMVASLATVSFAAKPEGKNKKTPEQRFAKADKNGDEKLSLDEFLGKRANDETKKAKATSKFEKLDKDSDKSLSLEEFKAAGKKKS